MNLNGRTGQHSHFQFYFMKGLIPERNFLNKKSRYHLSEKAVDVWQNFAAKLADT